MICFSNKFLNAADAADWRTTVLSCVIKRRARKRLIFENNVGVLTLGAEKNAERNEDIGSFIVYTLH